MSRLPSAQCGRDGGWSPPAGLPGGGEGEGEGEGGGGEGEGRGRGRRGRAHTHTHTSHEGMSYSCNTATDLQIIAGSCTKSQDSKYRPTVA